MCSACDGNNYEITDKDLEVITKAATNAAFNYLEDEKKRRHDNRLYNMKLLLRNYRSFVNHCSDSILTEINKADEGIENDFLDEKQEVKLMSIKNSKKKTLAMVRYIDKMLSVYKVMCQQSDKPEEVRRYDTIYHMYIAKKRKTSSEISEMHNIAVRTVFSDVEKAVKDLSVLVFGLDGMNFND